MVLTACDRWFDALVLLSKQVAVRTIIPILYSRSGYLPQFPPMTIVVVGRNSVIENIPAPFVHDVTKGQKDNFAQSHGK